MGLKSSTFVISWNYKILPRLRIICLSSSFWYITHLLVVHYAVNIASFELFLHYILMLWHSKMLLTCGALMTLEQVPLSGLVSSYWYKELTCKEITFHTQTNQSRVHSPITSFTLGPPLTCSNQPWAKCQTTSDSSCVLNILKWFKLANLAYMFLPCRNHNEVFTQFPLFLPPHWFFPVWPPWPCLPPLKQTMFSVAIIS